MILPGTIDFNWLLRPNTRMQEFDPNGAADPTAGIFGLNTTAEESQLVLLPVPWEATTSYGSGTSGGPAAILKASHQMDLFDLEIDRPYRAGIALLPEEGRVVEWGKNAKALAQNVISALTTTGQDSKIKSQLDEVNALSKSLNEFVFTETSKLLKAGKVVGLVGGDHSTPYGFIKALAAINPGFGILQIDAHCDLRKAYEGFTFSHASIMRNVLETIPQVTKLVQVGIRDFCEEEIEFAKSQKERVKIFFDEETSRHRFGGAAWKEIVSEIVASLPDKVYISFDIDGFNPNLCPHTGTPVPGGLEFQEVMFLLREVVSSGRKIIGFDLVEVSPGENSEWDANVGMRTLYKLCGCTLVSQGIVART